MTKEEQILLIEDLCGRLPYEVKARVKYWMPYEHRYDEGIMTVDAVNRNLGEVFACSDTGCTTIVLDYDDNDIVPYLFPMNSMTDEQKKELYEDVLDLSATITVNGIFECTKTDCCVEFDRIIKMVEWLNKNHFDYRGLIDKGLALNATYYDIY